MSLFGRVTRFLKGDPAEGRQAAGKSNDLGDTGRQQASDQYDRQDVSSSALTGQVGRSPSSGSSAPVTQQAIMDGMEEQSAKAKRERALTGGSHGSGKSSSASSTSGRRRKMPSPTTASFPEVDTGTAGTTSRSPSKPRSEQGKKKLFNIDTSSSILSRRRSSQPKLNARQSSETPTTSSRSYAQGLSSAATLRPTESLRGDSQQSASGSKEGPVICESPTTAKPPDSEQETGRSSPSHPAYAKFGPSTTEEEDVNHEGRGAHQRPPGLKSIPQRALLQRLPSQAITESSGSDRSTPLSGPTTPLTPPRGRSASNATATPLSKANLSSYTATLKGPSSKQGDVPTFSINEEPLSMDAEEEAKMDSKVADKPNDYRFPSVSTPAAIEEEGPPDTPRSEREEFGTPRSEKGEFGGLSSSPAQYPEEWKRARPARQTSQHRQYSSSSSQYSVSEHTSPQGFMKHRRNSSLSASREVKETLGAKSQDLPDGKRKLNQYILQRDIGKGSFGTVQIAKSEEDGKDYAVKEFSKMRLRKRQQSEMMRRQGRRGRRGAVPMRGRGSTRGRGGASPAFSETDSMDRVPSLAIDPAAEVNGRKATEEEIGQSDLDLIRSEIAVMKKLDHPNLVKLFEVLDVTEDDSLFMVLELCANGPIMSVGMGETAESLDEETCRNYFRQILLGVEYLHCNGIIHRDLKPENILRMKDPDIVKIVDFGVSEIFDKNQQDSSQDFKGGGSPAFMSPELCIANHGKVSGKAADIWALGVTLYCMVVGRLPFDSQHMLDLYDRIKSDPVLIPKELNPDLKDLLRQLLEKDPDKRIKMPDLREHVWVTVDGLDPLPSTEMNVTHLEEVTQDDIDTAISPLSVSYIVNAKRAANRWKRFTARRTVSQGDDSVSTGSSAEIARSSSLSTDSIPRTRNISDASHDLRRSTLDGLPHAWDKEERQKAKESAKPDLPGLPSAATFPLPDTSSKEMPRKRENSVASTSQLDDPSNVVVDFPMEIDRESIHMDTLMRGIDDCEVESIRKYEDESGDPLPRTFMSPTESQHSSRRSSLASTPA